MKGIKVPLYVSRTLGLALFVVWSFGFIGSKVLTFSNASLVRAGEFIIPVSEHGTTRFVTQAIYLRSQEVERQSLIICGVIFFFTLLIQLFCIERDGDEPRIYWVLKDLWTEPIVAGPYTKLFGSSLFGFAIGALFGPVFIRINGAVDQWLRPSAGRLLLDTDLGLQSFFGGLAGVVVAGAGYLAILRSRKLDFKGCKKLAGMTFVGGALGAFLDPAGSLVLAAVCFLIACSRLPQQEPGWWI